MMEMTAAIANRWKREPDQTLIGSFASACQAQMELFITVTARFILFWWGASLEVELDILWGYNDMTKTKSIWAQQQELYVGFDNICFFCCCFLVEFQQDKKNDYCYPIIYDVRF